MAQFSTAPVEEVVPPKQLREPSKRAQMQEQYQAALKDAVAIRHEALVIALEAEDKALTVRNRVKRAADALGLNVVIRRRQNRILAYSPDGEHGTA